MTLLKKEIIRPARVYPFDSNGKEFPVDIDYGRTARWTEKLQKLFNKGYKLPIAYPMDDSRPHPEAAKPLGPGEQIPRGPDGKPLYKVGGYFTKVEFEKDGTIWLHGDPETEEDLQKLKKTGVSLQTDSLFIDRDGERYDDVIVHVLSTDKPIFQKQSNWKTSDGMALSMAMPSTPLDSSYLGTPLPAQAGGETVNSLDSVLQLLAEHGIELPEDTTEQNFLDRLGTALRAVKSYKEQEMGDEDLTQPPEGSQRVRPTPIAMAKPDNFADFVLQTLTKTPTNPATGQGWTKPELEAAHQASQPPVLKLSAADQKRIDWANEQVAKGLADRCNALVHNLVITQETANDWMERLTTEAIQLAAQEGRKTSVEELIEMAEQLRPGGGYTGIPLPPQVQGQQTKTIGQLALSGGLDQGVQTHQHPQDFYGPRERTDEEVEKDADEILARLGK